MANGTGPWGVGRPAGGARRMDALGPSCIRPRGSHALPRHRRASLGRGPGCGGQDPRIFAGNGTSGYSGDSGLAVNASLSSVTALARAPDGTRVHPRQRRARSADEVGTVGVITTFAGTGTAGSVAIAGRPPPRSSATRPISHSPRTAVSTSRTWGTSAFDGSTLSGTITTVAGTGAAGPSGDGGPATSAALAGPVAFAPAPDGSLYIADGRAIRQLTTDGYIATRLRAMIRRRAVEATASRRRTRVFFRTSPILR